MTRRWGIGLAIFALAIIQGFHNMADQIGHMETWDGIYKPSVVAPFLDSIGLTLAGFISGQIVPTLRKTKDPEEPDVPLVILTGAPQEKP